MKILLIYATNSSGTYEAAQAIADELSAAKHTVAMQHAKDTEPKNIPSADLLILGSCTWERFNGDTRTEGELQQHMHALIEAWKKQPPTPKKIAVFGLGDRSYTNFCQAADRLEAFVRTIEAEQVGQTLRIDSWFFNQPANRQQAVAWAKSIAEKIASTRRPT